MLTFINSFIDAVQSSKSSYIDFFVKQEDYKKPLKAFIDAQTNFTKVVAKSTYDVATKVSEELVNFDLSKALKVSK